MASDITTEFTINVKMQDRWIPHFLSMLEHMQYLGDIGASREITFFSDGDGDFRPEFEWGIESKIAEPLRDKEGTRYYDAG